MCIPTLKTTSGVHYTSQSKAAALNVQFSSVFTSDNDLPVPEKGPSPYLDIGDLIIGKEGVAKQLRQLKPNKASGPDDIPARMLKSMQIILLQCLLISCSNHTAWVNYHLIGPKQESLEYIRRVTRPTQRIIAW